MSQDPKVQEWVDKCDSVLTVLFGKKSDERKGFRSADFPVGKISTLQMLAAKVSVKLISKSPSTIINVNQTQITTIKNEISLQILLKIEHSNFSEEEKKEATDLLKEVNEEVQKSEPNWKKVTDLLKKSFDYGLKIAPDIVKLADAYYKAKGGV
ncbi:hypothetical protein [Robertmurraya sp.]|uniref:hypothetical protein n=1 Tax=Robertmurraya sp. TaxID=2837525 RepID=UPI003703D6BB